MEMWVWAIKHPKTQLLLFSIRQRSQVWNRFRRMGRNGTGRKKKGYYRKEMSWSVALKADVNMVCLRNREDQCNLNVGFFWDVGNHVSSASEESLTRTEQNLTAGQWGRNAAVSRKHSFVGSRQMDRIWARGRLRLMESTFALYSRDPAESSEK